MTNPPSRHLFALVAVPLMSAITACHAQTAPMQQASPRLAQNIKTTAASTRASQSTPLWDTISDTWIATDALGRTTPTNAQVGAPRKNKTVAMFYFMWIDKTQKQGPYDISKILAKDPNAIKEPNNPLWGPMGAIHYWGKPVFDYYIATDEWVLRKHAQMLSDAGVDCIFLDVTNNYSYPDVYPTIFRVFSQIRKEGGRAPQIAFMMPFWADTQLTQTLYNTFYKKGEYKNVWFHWKGKPLILSNGNRIGITYMSSSLNEPVQLPTGHTQGQSFRAERPFSSVGGSNPAWMQPDERVGMTLTLRRGGPQGEAVARKRFDTLFSSYWHFMDLPKPLPAGDYYLEQSDPVGTIGWWKQTNADYQDGQAFIDGKPVAGDFTLGIGYDTPERRELLNFFTYRLIQGEITKRGKVARAWGWLDAYPQPVYKTPDGKPEQITVGVAQNVVDEKVDMMTNPRSRGRSYHNGVQPPPEQQDTSGRNFAEQWKRALQIDPQLVLVTEWNEWAALRFGPNDAMGGYAPVTFPDNFSQEYSRDIEPMEGGHTDNYYYQLIDNVRRYKGARGLPAASGSKTINLKSGFSQWKSVAPEYRDDRFDTTHRNEQGYGTLGQLINTTGRNDIVRSKVARDAKHLYFYAQTRQPLKAANNASTRDWMTLWLNADNSAKSGFLGFGFKTVFDAKSTVKAGGTLRLDTFRNGKWTAIARVPFVVRGNEMMLSIPRNVLNLNGRNVQFDFKWTDNVNVQTDALNFYRNGDTAPNGRFRYRYTSVTTPSKPAR